MELIAQNGFWIGFSEVSSKGSLSGATELSRLFTGMEYSSKKARSIILRADIIVHSKNCAALDIVYLFI